MKKRKNTKKKAAKKKNNSPLKPKNNIEELKSSRDGGQIALRGYSYQFMYSCYLILTTLNRNSLFNLEGVEDIDSVIYKDDKQNTTHIQLKYSINKQNASFMSSVLKNFIEAYLLDKDRNFKLVYDFPVATGHLSKLFQNNLDSNSLSYWKNVIDEIKENTSLWNWSDFEFDDFVAKISFENVKKDNLSSEIEKALIQNYNITTDNVGLFADSIKVFCLDKMERRLTLDLEEVKKHIELVKFDISKGVVNPAHSWIKKLNYNISEKDADFGYYEGKKAAPIDIVNGLAVSRPSIEKEIVNSIFNNTVTVIKSSSGQGKTTLALKVAFLLQGEYTPYQLTWCNDAKELGNIVEYFRSRTRLGEKPLILLDNLDAHLCEWNELAQLMQSSVTYHYKLIITSRENDWYNYAGDISNVRSLNVVKPILSENEAKDIFNALQKSGKLHSAITNWQNSWSKIAEKKLLIEYVYLLTHGEMLSDRISSQMKEIGNSSTGNVKFEILRKVCFADVCGIKLPSNELLKNLTGTFSGDLGELLKSMADEFLVNINQDGKYVEGLHPIRSQHIVNRLHEYYPLDETAMAITVIADKEDLSVLFSHFPEFDFDKTKFYSNIVDVLWDVSDLSPYVLAIRGTFSGSVMQYFMQNKSFFDDANDHGGLLILASEICPFAKFEEIAESINTLDKFAEMQPDNKNIKHLFHLRDTIPKFDTTQTDICIFCQKLYKKLENVLIVDVVDINSYAIIISWLYNMDTSLNLSQNITLDKLWTTPEKYSLETISSLMYTSFCGNKNEYFSFVQENLDQILIYLKHKTQSHRLYTDNDKKVVYVEYILRASEINRGNEESVSRLNKICKTLPIFKTYCSDAIKPKINMLSMYKVPDSSHKEMPLRNLVITYHKEFTSLWIKTILSNYEFDSMREWIEHWFSIRKLICEGLEKSSKFIYKILERRNTKNLGNEIGSLVVKLNKSLTGEFSYPKQYRPFEKSPKLPENFSKLRNDYFGSIQNFFNQFPGVIGKKYDSERLSRVNLKISLSSLSDMQMLFEKIGLENQYYKAHKELCEQEDQRLHETYMCCEYYKVHQASTHCNKILVKNWYDYEYKNKLNEAEKLLETIKEDYEIEFPLKIYENGLLSYYPIIVKGFDASNGDAFENFILNATPFAKSSFDYLILLSCDAENKINSKAIQFSKKFFEACYQSMTLENEKSLESLVPPYPVVVTQQMLNCFDRGLVIQENEKVNPYISYIVDTAEELWVYSKTRDLLSNTKDEKYCNDSLSELKIKIASMFQKMEDNLSIELVTSIKKLCESVYDGTSFDNEQLNEVVNNAVNIKS